ncbi:hypothetical protein K4H28_13490 [Deefgea tanakiae]|uniref:Uncharacterized protein n=1 Tax=Deefgea tanakiae TaxID=2865840 RepID=A0ABX8Z656_9NEIS|nr:hypothetical protein [Deefgea tanakiae]QZA77285.1 hypothetical protein K4H28_13490 [Deefgea tanakiae]
MKVLRLFFFCVLLVVLPVNSVLAQMPAYAKITSAYTDHAPHQHDETGADLSHALPDKQIHIHQGLFGKQSVHVHEPIASVSIDCVNACQTMPNSVIFDSRFTVPFPLVAILVDASCATLFSVTLAPLEDPPKFRA